MNKNKRRTMIAIITVILLIVLSLWLFTKASEDTEETGTTTDKPVYQSYRNNILGVAGDFAVFTYGDAIISQVTADIAVGGDLTGQGFGNYDTNWDFYKSNDLKFVNLNSYVRGSYNSGTYNWKANKTQEDLTTSSGIIKGIYSNLDTNKEHGQANLYIYTGENGNNVAYPEAANANEVSNRVTINNVDYENTPFINNTINSYNVVEVDYEFIDFEQEFNNLVAISERLINAEEQVQVDCIPEDGSQTYTYNFPEGQDTVLITVEPENFFNKNLCNRFNIQGLDSSKKIVINVDCTNYVTSSDERYMTPIIEVNGSAADWNNLAENIVFNYYLAEFNNRDLESRETIGTILAPNMNIYINGNLDGTVITRDFNAGNNAIYGINSNIGWDDITNPIIERTSITGTKTWNDKGEEDKRPEQITIKLLANGEETGKTVTLPKVITNDTSSDNSGSSASGENDIEYYIRIDHSGISDWWAHSNKTFTVTIEYTNGQTKTITATGAQLSDWGYDANVAKITVPAGTTAKVTINTVETTTNYGAKVEISENTTGINGITGNWAVFKLASGATDTTATIVNSSAAVEPEEPEMPEENDEDKLDWTYKFEKLEKYDEDGNEIKYTVEEVEVEGYVSEIIETDKGYDIINTIKTEISGEKIWDDDNDRDGKRPESIIVELYEKGKDGVDDVKVDEIEIKQGEAEDTWSYKFEDIKKYDEDGKEIEYIVKETKVEKYDEPVIEGNAKDGFKITNKYTPEKINVKVTKVWKDDNNRDRVRPSTVTVQLLKGEKVVETKEMNSDKWECTFEDLFKYEDGKEIEYTVKEVAIEGDYSSAVAHSSMENWTITNTYNPKKISFEVTKVWDDSDNQDGKRPDEITVKLLANGKEVEDATKTITAADDWKCEFTDLVKFENGQPIEYTVEEVAVENYEKPVVKGSAEEGFTITNKYTPETTSISVTKDWDDNNNQDNLRPDSITINVLANGTKVDSKTITADDEWRCTFTGLAKYAKGEVIAYTVEEEEVNNYTNPEITGNMEDGFVITNKYNPETTSVNVTKTWDDGNNQDNLRPDSITVRLFADGEEVDSKTVTADDKWKCSFVDLPKNKDGKAIEYTIKEDAVEGYETTIDGYTITNTHATESITVSGVKTWVDDDNKEEVRPESITVRLFADGKEVEGSEKTVTAEDEWKYTFKDLPRYNEGTEIVYTIDEDAVEGYEKTIEGYNLTNTHTVIDSEEMVPLRIIKVWEDEGYEEFRPKKVTVNLLANGEVIETVEITANDSWEYTFRDMEKYDEDGKEIVYTVTEEAITGYETTIEGLKITNTYIPPVKNDEIVIKINKYQTGTTTKLEGAEFEIKVENKDGKEVLKKTSTTNTIGQIMLKDIELEAGDYTLIIKEKEAPDGYIIKDKQLKIEFTVSEDETGKQTMKLKEKYKNAEIEKMTITVKVENDKEKTQDKTTATGKLPQTGAGNMIAIISVVIAFIAIGAVGIFKYRDIKF